ncbi:MAG TPA: HAMP domain-containing sensor histidine kinase [Candidatus Saccharibacteria bacterium]|nr:HAMP domain-containing sensor histidine kinase [Candidatus Saccharibacteria bacterium]
MKKNNDRTWRLALSYFGIIMTMSLLFSAVIYFITSVQLDRPLPPQRPGEKVSTLPNETEDRIAERDRRTRLSILGSLAIINVLVAAGGAGLSYYLARRTLRPIEEAMERQAQFVSDASHELRTPLTALQTSNEVALRKPKITEEKARDVFRRTIIETEKLRDLADTLLNLAKAGQQSDVLEEVQLTAFMDDIVSRVQPLADKKATTIVVDAPSQQAKVHPGIVRQILTILLDNAIKYSPEESQVNVLVRTNGRSLKVTVIDQGIGISKKDQPHIFERFYRADNARTRTEASGHGLGLSIAKQLADTYGYILNYERHSGQGSSFTLERL